MLKFISLLILIASAYTNLADKSDVSVKPDTNDISQTALGATINSHLNRECVDDIEFYHPQSSRCLQCSQYCANPESKFCKASCPNYCPDGFRHPILKRCISCSQLCNKDKVLSEQDKEFCSNNCDMYMYNTRCPDGEFYYQPNDSCLPCSNVCGPNKKKGYCSRNCPGYLPKENTTEMVLTTIMLSAITPTVKSIPNSTSQESGVTFVEFLNQRPYLAIVIIVILMVLLIAAIVRLVVGMIPLRKNRNTGSRGSEDDLLPRGVSDTEMCNFEDEKSNAPSICSHPVSPEAKQLLVKSSLEPNNVTELDQENETGLSKLESLEQENKSAGDTGSIISLKESSICEEAMPNEQNRPVDSCGAIVTLPSSRNSNDDSRIEQTSHLSFSA